MLPRTAILAILICTSSLPLYSKQQSVDGCPAPVEQYGLERPDVCRLELPLQETEGASVPASGLDGNHASRGPDANARALQLIAIYASVGNREGVEILAAQLRAQGVSAEARNEAVTWTKLHGSSEQRPTNAAKRLAPDPDELAMIEARSF